MANENPFAPENRAESSRRVIDIPGVHRPDSPGGSQGKKLIVGREISLSGQISACDTLVVEGTVEASLSNSRTVEIAETGIFRGEIEIDVAEISGQFEGSLTARTRLIIRGKGRVTGTIRYAELEIERGGRIAGQVEVIEKATAAGPNAAERN
jgi:cytoskeletal protein CcmA (bactofilin family)